MSVSYNAVVVLGLTYKEIMRVSGEIRKAEKMSESEFFEELYSNGINQFQPAYDSPREENIFGIAIQSTGDYSYSELEFDSYQERIDLAKERIYSLFPSAELKLYLSTDSY